MAKIQIKLLKGLVGKTDRAIKNAAALGLFKKNQVVEHNDTPDIRGKIEWVKHLVAIHEIK